MDTTSVHRPVRIGADISAAVEHQDDDNDNDDECIDVTPPPPPNMIVYIQRQPPLAVFLDELFEIDVLVKEAAAKTGDNHTTMSISICSHLGYRSSSYDVLASLISEDATMTATTTTTADASVQQHDANSMAMLLVHHNPSPISVDAVGTLQCCITTESMRRLFMECCNPIYRIHISIFCCYSKRSTTTSTTTTILNDHQHGDTTTIPSPYMHVAATVVSNRIMVVTHKIQVTPSIDWSSIWYKDEGGRDKCLEVVVGVYDQQQSLLYNESIPLLLTLCYGASSSSSSQQQKSSRSIHHHAPIPVTNQDILRILSPKTKQLATDATTGRIKVSFRIEDVSKNHQGQDFSLQVSVADDDENCGGQQHRVVAPGLSPLVTIRSKRNKRGRATTATTSLLSTTKPPKHALIQPKVSRSELAVDGSFDVDDSYMLQIRDAVHGVTQWVGDVVSGLYPLQWKVAGYSYDVHGRHDYHRPLFHNMQNPNALIARVLKAYNESTRDQLQLLQQSVESNNSFIASRPMASCATPSYPGYPFSSLREFGVNDYYSGGGMEATKSFYPLRDDHNALLSRPVEPNVPSTGMQSNRWRGCLPSEPTTTRNGTKHKNKNMTPSSVLSSVIQEMLDENCSAATENSVIHTADQTCNTEEVALSDKACIVGTHCEGDVEYILALPQKSVRTGKSLGYPAYASDRSLLGFYCSMNSDDDSLMTDCVFVPLHPMDFGPKELAEAMRILLHADPAAVQSLRERGSISAMLDFVRIYNFQQKSLRQSK